MASGQVLLPMAVSASEVRMNNYNSSHKLRIPRGLGEQINVEPTIIVDTREQDPLVFSRLESERGTLSTGDYSIKGLETLFVIERKSIADLVSCCMGENRERFERELHRLRGFRFKRLLVVGTEEEIYQGRYRSAITPKAVMATLGAFEVRYDLPVAYRSTPELAARQIESWAYWFAREQLLAAARLTRCEPKNREDG